MKALGLKRWGVGGALIGALALGGCSSMHEQTWTMSTTDKIPSATGKVKVKGEKDGNTRVKVEVAHLAQPSSTFDATTYVVWLKPADGRAQNVGVLSVWVRSDTLPFTGLPEMVANWMPVASACTK